MYGYLPMELDFQMQSNLCATRLDRKPWCKNRVVCSSIAEKGDCEMNEYLMQMNDFLVDISYSFVCLFMVNMAINTLTLIFTISVVLRDNRETAIEAQGQKNEVERLGEELREKAARFAKEMSKLKTQATNEKTHTF